MLLHLSIHRIQGNKVKLSMTQLNKKYDECLLIIYSVHLKCYEEAWRDRIRESEKTWRRKRKGGDE